MRLTFGLSALVLSAVVTAAVNSSSLAQTAGGEPLEDSNAAAGGRFTFFTAPDGVCGPGSAVCTFPTAINAAGVIAGYYVGVNATNHGFVRLANGTIVDFDVPGSACPNGYSSCTMPTGINAGGAIVGSFSDASGVAHGFLRDAAGNYTSFDPPGSAFTQPYAINAHDTVTGLYCNASTCLGFVRAKDGTFTDIVGPGAVNGTWGSAINDAGEIAGLYADASDVLHGFLRTPDGTVTSFDPPDSVYVFQSGINNEGTIVGTYATASADLSFLRDKHGKYTTFSGNAVGISDIGMVAGYVPQPSGVGTEGFYRLKSGHLGTFLPPHGLVTNVTAVSPCGKVVGWYASTTYLNAAFVWERHAGCPRSEDE